MSYMPDIEGQARDWMVNFAWKLTLDPTRYAIDATDAASIQSAVDAFVAAFLLCVDKDTRTSSNVITKDQTRSQAEKICRYWAMLIKANADVNDADKNGLGLHINDSTPRERVPAPASWPLLTVLASTPGAQTLRYTDAFSGAKRKPQGVMQLQLFRAITEGGVGTLDEARFVGNFTRNPIAVPFDPDDNTKTATYFARWATRNKVGPWCNPQSMTIAA